MNERYVLRRPSLPQVMTTGSSDFLVVTALPDETDAVLRHVENVAQHPSGRYSITSVPRKFGNGHHIVVIAEVGVGPTKAQAATREAIHACRPKRVVLVGIAAGFQSAGVDYGDVLVPDAIVDYEHAKV